MCKSISLLSGKGGSGKTTLALSMASMLSKCNIKVLLVDCDISTNGATYFYENKLNYKKNYITSFYEVIFHQNNKVNFIKINNQFDFMPSITQITKKNTKTYSYRNDSVLSIYDELCKKYDVILFDCQAGYTDVLKLLLPLVDVNLVVMEADSISSSAIRSLYLKIGEIVNDKKIYQVFNKVTEEEFEIYSKISGGTVFTNIETVKFDWKIRKAFSVAKVPDMENSSANYGKQIYNICTILFPDDYLKDKLNEFKTILEIHNAEEREKEINSVLEHLRSKNAYTKNREKKKYIILSSIYFIFISYFIFLFTFEKLGSKNIIITLIQLLFPVIISMFNMLDINKERRTNYNEIIVNQQKLKEIINKKDKLQRKLKINNQNKALKIRKV